MSTRKTRADDTVLKLLGESLDVERHIELTGNRLPNNKTVLLSLLAHRAKLNQEHPNRKVDYKSEVEVYSKLQVHYRKANIPVISRGGVFGKLDKLLARFDNNKRSIKRGNFGQFQDMLTETFKVWPNNVFEKLEIKLRDEESLEIEIQVVEHDRQKVSDQRSVKKKA